MGIVVNAVFAALIVIGFTPALPDYQAGAVGLVWVVTLLGFGQAVWYCLMYAYMGVKPYVHKQLIASLHTHLLYEELKGRPIGSPEHREYQLGIHTNWAMVADFVGYDIPCTIAMLYLGQPLLAGVYLTSMVGMHLHEYMRRNMWVALREGAKDGVG